MSNSNIKILHGQRQEKKGLQVHHNIALYRNLNVSSGLEDFVTVWIGRFTTFCLAAFWTAGTHAQA